jgi:hypothetical protein
VLLKVFERTVLYPEDHSGAQTSVVSNPVAPYQLKQFEKNTMSVVGSDVVTSLNVVSGFKTAYGGPAEA